MLVTFCLFITIFIYSSALDSSIVYKKYLQSEAYTIIRFQDRCDRVQSFCTKYVINDGTKYEYISKNLIVDIKHNLTWCPVYKAASTTWMKNFAQLMNIAPKENIDWNLAVRNAYKNENINNTITIKFLIVRHPFERLLSAYRDKLEHRSGREYYFQQYGMLMKRLYRHHWQSQEEPTFREFLQFLTNRKQPDLHWKSIAMQCDPCLIHYDYIIKTETFTEDNYLLINKMKLTKELDYLTKENTNTAGVTDEKMAAKYYSTITRSLLMKIYKLYEDDFLLFGYTPEKYLNMTINS